MFNVEITLIINWYLIFLITRYTLYIIDICTLHVSAHFDAINEVGVYIVLQILSATAADKYI